MFTVSGVDTGAHIFNWSAAKDGQPLGVDAVIVKGGWSANVYAYDPEASSGSGLHAPVNHGKRYAGLSHITFCVDAPTPPAGGKPRR